MNNFTNNRWLTVVTLLLITANIITLVFLWTTKNDAGNGKMPPPGGQVFEFITNELKLDEGQQALYKQLREEHQAGQRPRHDSIVKAKDVFFALLKDSTTTDSTIRNYSKKIADLEEQQELFTFYHFQKLRAICRNDQKIKFDSIIQDVLKRMGSQKRQGPPPGRDRDDRRPPPAFEQDDKRPIPQE